MLMSVFVDCRTRLHTFTRPMQFIKRNSTHVYTSESDVEYLSADSYLYESNYYQIPAWHERRCNNVVHQLVQVNINSN